MRHLKLATISVLYSVSMVLLLTAVGVVVFRESLNRFELAGIVLAVASLILLMRRVAIHLPSALRVPVGNGTLRTQ
jgi:drug/metabolite transporter (DMT)-like permease